MVISRLITMMECVGPHEQIRYTFACTEQPACEASLDLARSRLSFIYTYTMSIISYQNVGLMTKVLCIRYRYQHIVWQKAQFSTLARSAGGGRWAAVAHIPRPTILALHTRRTHPCVQRPAHPRKVRSTGRRRPATYDSRTPHQTHSSMRSDVPTVDVPVWCCWACAGSGWPHLCNGSHRAES